MSSKILILFENLLFFNMFNNFYKKLTNNFPKLSHILDGGSDMYLQGQIQDFLTGGGFGWKKF